MGVDLGGIAKGFAVDEVRKIYAKYGIENGLINLGGSSLYASDAEQGRTSLGGLACAIPQG